MKVFYSAEEIEDLAARGMNQLTLDDEAVLTDLARDAAQRLGVFLVYRSSSSPAPSSTGSFVPLATDDPRGVKVEFWAKRADPRGGDAAGSAQSFGADPEVPNSMIDRAIGLVRQLARR